jgi:hypothetical protein
MADRLRVFIGSAAESQHVAEALQAVLPPMVEVSLWPDVFNLGEYVVDDLREAAREHDFAIFVFAPDDDLTTRGATYVAPRDNVVFELGIFSSFMGPRRAFVIKAEGESLKVPSDLAGVTYAIYQPPDAPPTDARWESALRPAARKVRRAVEREAKRHASAALPQGALPSAEQAPADMLARDLLAAARLGRLESLADAAQGALVVHRAHGLGIVVGYDPPAPDRGVRVRFSSGDALVPQTELFAAGEAT